YGLGNNADVFAIDHDAQNNLLVFVFDTGSRAVREVDVPTCGAGPAFITYGTVDARHLWENDRQIFASANQSFDPTIYRATIGRVEIIDGPPASTGEPPDVYVTRDGVVYAAGDHGLYGMTDYVEAHRPAPGETPLLKDLVRIAIATDGTIVECSQHVMVSSGFGFATLGTQGCTGSSCCAALYAQYASNILASFTSG